MGIKNISENNDRLLRLEYKSRVLHSIEELGDSLYVLTQKVEAGMFYEALQVYKHTFERFTALDVSIRQTPLMQRLMDLLTGKKAEIRQLCVYFLIDQIFNTEVFNPGEELLAQIDFGQIVLDLAEPDQTVGEKELEDLVPDPLTVRQKSKFFGRKRIRFIFSLVKNMEELKLQQYLSYLDLQKLDQMLEVMFDRELVKVFQELTNGKSELSQADEEINYFNIFLSVRCLKELEPECCIPELLVANLDENFNRIILNCFTAFLKELYVLEMNTTKLNSPRLPFFFWDGEYSKTLLPASFLLSAVPHLESASKLIMLLLFYTLQYLADFTKLCLFLSDQASLKTHLGALVQSLSQKIAQVMEKLFLRMGKPREDEALLLVSEDFNAKCFEVEKRLNLTYNYFPLVMQLVMRVLNKGLNSLGESLDPSLQGDFSREAGNCMGSLCENLYKRYFLILKTKNVFEQVTKDPRNLEVFHFRQADRDRLIEEVGEGAEPRPYLPAAEYVKVVLDDICLLFGLMSFEHHQRFVLAHYNWCLYSFIQLLVDKFKADIEDYNMTSLKKSLGFKDLLVSDYSFHQFTAHIALPGQTEGKDYLPEDEYFKALAHTYSTLSAQQSALPVQAFREDKYVRVGDNLALVFECFVNVKLSFNKNLLFILSTLNEAVVRRLVNDTVSSDARPSNQIEREKAQQILITNLLTEIRRPKSEIAKKADEIYKSQKTAGQSFEEFSLTSIDSQVLMLFYYYWKFDRMLVELYLSLKVIIHLTILVHLAPRFQPTAAEEGEKLIVSGNLVLTFAKKYRMLVEALAACLSPVLLSFLFDESLHLVSTQLEENLFELMKYSPKSVPTLLPLLNTLQQSLGQLSVYQFEAENLKRIGKRLKRFLQLFEKALDEEALMKILADNPDRYTKKQIVNFVLAMNNNTPRGQDLPFNLSLVLKKAGDSLRS